MRVGCPRAGPCHSPLSLLSEGLQVQLLATGLFEARQCQIPSPALCRPSERRIWTWGDSEGLTEIAGTCREHFPSPVAHMAPVCSATGSGPRGRNVFAGATADAWHAACRKRVATPACFCVARSGSETLPFPHLATFARA